MDWRWVGIVALGLSSACASGGAKGEFVSSTVADVKIPSKRARLDNGLEVILHEDHSTPFVAVRVVYRVGSRDDGPGHEELAHLVEHAMFRGSKHVADHAHFEQLHEAGAHLINATTSLDVTSYFETVPRGALELALYLEAERMAFGLESLTEAKLAKERGVVENERRLREADRQYGVLYPLVQGELFPPGHPYHRTANGAAADLALVPLAQVRAFHRAHYAPNNATLILVGDFDSERALASIGKLFGPIVPRPVPARSAGPFPQLGREVRLEIEAAVERPRVMVGWATFPRLAAGSAELAVGESLASSALYHVLVTDRKVADVAGLYLHFNELGGILTLSMVPRDGKTPEQCLAEADDEIHSLRGLRYTQESVERRIASLLTRRVRDDLESFDDRAELFADYDALGREPDAFGRELESIRATTRDDVRDALYQFMPFDARVVAIVRPRADAPPSGRLVRRTP